MTISVNLILNLKKRGALNYCAMALKDAIEGVDIRLVDYRDTKREGADVDHYYAWFFHQNSGVKSNDSSSMVTIHHTCKRFPYLQKIIDCGVPLVTMSAEWDQLLGRMGTAEHRKSLVPHGIDMEFWKPGETSKQSFPFTIGIVGRVYDEGRKGERILDKLFSYLSTSNIRIVIVGEGWDPTIEKLRKMGFAIEHYSNLDIVQLRTLYQQFSVFLCTSDVEGGPLPLVEAMAMGITPVSTPVGLARDLIPGRDTGYIYPKGNAYAAASIIKKLYTGQLPEKCPKKLRDSAKLVSWSNAADGYRQVYEAVSLGRPLPMDPTGFMNKVRHRSLSAIENFCLVANPYPTDQWTQPIFWRTVNKVGRNLQRIFPT